MEKYDPNCSFGLTDISQVRSVKAQAWIAEEEAKLELADAEAAGEAQDPN